MNPKITFYPLGNAETILFELGNERKLLIDFADTHTDKPEDKRINLSSELKKHASFDTVVFTHAHEDHVKGAKDFFVFDHASKYQGEGRSKIEELWVSAAFMLDSNLCEDARVIRQEARHRLKEGYGIKVFSEPDAINQWLVSNDLDPDDVSHFIYHAGELLTNDSHNLGDKIQFFIHAPFSDDADDANDRNDSSIVMQIRFLNDNRDTNVFITGDVPHWVLDKVIERSVANDNEEYLYWDIYDIPHHCSYTGLDDERGDEITESTDNIKSFLQKYGNTNGFMVASCRSFVEIGEDDNDPPHIEAKRAYELYASAEKRFFFTMEYENPDNPKPIKFEVKDHGVTEIDECVNILTKSVRAG